jgi:hypothetical protein
MTQRAELITLIVMLALLVGAVLFGVWYYA